MLYYSNCCDAIITDSDLCSDCKEHSTPIAANIRNLKQMEDVCNDFLPETVEDFCRANITRDDAVNIAISDDSFREEYLEHNTLSILETLSAVEENAEELAYHLAFTSPLTGAKLLDELLYYRKQGVL